MASLMDGHCPNCTNTVSRLEEEVTECLACHATIGWRAAEKRWRLISVTEPVSLIAGTDGWPEPLSPEEELFAKIESAKNGDYVENPEHYDQYRIEPYFFLVANNVPFAEGNVIKYVLRWRKKNGIEDLKKARRCIDLLIEAEERGIPEIKPER